MFDSSWFYAFFGVFWFQGAKWCHTGLCLSVPWPEEPVGLGDAGCWCWHVDDDDNGDWWCRSDVFGGFPCFSYTDWFFETNDSTANLLKKMPNPLRDTRWDTSTRSWWYDSGHLADRTHHFVRHPSTSSKSIGKVWYTGIPEARFPQNCFGWVKSTPQKVAKPLRNLGEQSLLLHH